MGASIKKPSKEFTDALAAAITKECQRRLDAGELEDFLVGPFARGFMASYEGQLDDADRLLVVGLADQTISAEFMAAARRVGAL